LTLSLRCFAISSLSKAAYTLSNISPQEVNQSELKNLKEKKLIPNPTENLNEHKELLNNCTKKSKSTMKTPLKYKLLKSKSNTIQNNFGVISHLFFYPILHILAITISNNSKIQKKDISDIHTSKNIKGAVNLNIIQIEEPFIRNSNTMKTLKNDSKDRLHNDEEGNNYHRFYLHGFIFMNELSMNVSIYRNNNLTFK
jgi:hypothetical protein